MSAPWTCDCGACDGVPHEGTPCPDPSAHQPSPSLAALAKVRDALGLLCSECRRLGTVKAALAALDAMEKP